jgi:DNA-3-methyladenine glycosylase II
MGRHGKMEMAMRSRSDSGTRAKAMRHTGAPAKPSSAKARSDGKKTGTKRRSPRRTRETKALVWHPGPPIDSETALSAGIAALREKDPEFVDRVLAAAGVPALRTRPPGLEGLIWIVVSQQLSTASAGAIFARFRALFPTLEPAAILATSDEALRGCGLSAAKIRTLRAICETIVKGGLDLVGLTHDDAAEAHRILVAIKGIGPWTADIFLLSCLGHPDAWPAGDLALQEAARLALGLKQRPDAAKLAAIGERWRPWRAVAARLLWTYYRAVKGREGMMPGA